MNPSRKNLVGIVLILAGTALSGNRSMAQATIDIFFCNAYGVNAPIYGIDGVTALSGANFQVELAYDMTPLGTTGIETAPPAVGFNIPEQGGYFSGGIRTISCFDAGTKFTAWVRAWDSNTGATFDQATVRGISDPLTFTVPQPPAENTPPNLFVPLTGLKSFDLALVPEPAETSLVVAGVCAILTFCRGLVRSRARVGR
jgi:hypothetical protein